MATVAPSGMSLTACSGEATILFMVFLGSQEWLRRAAREHTRTRGSPSWQCERDHVVAQLRSERRVTARGDHDQLPAARRAIGHGRRLTARRQIAAPEDTPRLDVESAQYRVARRADEDQPARGREGAAKIQRARNRW